MNYGSGRQGGPGGSGLLALTLVVVLLVGALASSTAVVGATAALANDGGNDTTGGNTATDDRTVIDQCTTLGNTGTEYRLGSNLSTDSGTCLTITASHVDLDGDGFSVSGTDSSSAIAVVPETSGATVENVTVHDVRVNDSNVGVRAGKSGEDVSDVTLQNVTAIDNSRAGVVSFETANLRIVDSDLRRNGDGAELLRGSATLVGVTARNNTGAGLSTALGLEAVTVTGGTFSDNDGHGLLVRDVAAGETSVTNVIADGNEVHGVELEATPGATLANVTATNNADDGLRLETNRTTVTGANASDNGAHGFHLPGLDTADDARVLRSGEAGLVALRNGGAGARLAGSNTIVSGLNATDNDVGVDLTDATGVTVTDATPSDGTLGTKVRSNAHQGVLLSNADGSTVEETLVQDNGAAGIRVESPGDNTLRQLRVRGNAPAFVTTGPGTTSVSGLAIQNVTVTFDATNVSVASTVPPEPARPGNRTFGTYLDIGTIGDTTTAAVTGEVVGSIDLTVQYPDGAVRDPPLVEDTARIHSYDGSWSAVGDSTNDPAANNVSASLENPTAVYAPAADLENAITSCGFTDWSSGETYRIDADLSSTSGACLQVRASDATVVGYGFGGEQRRLLTGDADTDGLGIDVRPGQTNVTLQNLQVGSFGTGVRLGSGPSATPANHTLERVIVNDSVGTGIVVDGDAATFRTVDVIDSGGDGIALRSSRDSSLAGLYLLGNAGSDLVLSGDTAGTTAENVELFVDSDRDGTGRAVNVSFDAANEVTFSTVADPPAPGAGLEGVTDYVDVEGQASDAFVNLSVAYDEAEVPDTAQESDLGMYNYDEQSGEYEGVTQGAFQSEANDVVGANLTSFSTFAPLVDTAGSDGGSTPSPTPDGSDGGDGSSTPTPTDGGGSDGGDGSSTPTPTDGGGSDGSDGSSTPTPTPTPDGSDGTDGSGGTDDGTETSSGQTPAGSGGGGGGGGGGAGSADTSSPSFATRSASVNRTSMRVGGAVRIDATVENSGEGGGTYEVELFRNGDFVQSRFVELVPGEREEISFTRTPSSTGEYTYRVENVTAGTVRVVGEDEPTPTPTATPTPTSDTSTTTQTVTDDGESPTPTSDDRSGSIENQATSGPTPGSPDGGVGTGLGPLGMVVGGIGALAVGAGTIYLLVLKP